MPSLSQYITLTAAGLGSVRALMQEQSPKLEDGNPIWDTVARPNRPSLTIWRGRNPYQITLPLLFDDEDGVEADLNTLDRMRRSPSTGVQPPAIRLSGAVPRRDIKNWVITNIEFGDVVLMTSFKGVPVRTRQDVVVTLIERIDENRVANAVIRPRHPFHIVQTGETLAQISQKEYGDAAHVAAIRKANNLTDSRKIKKNMRLRMP